MSIKPIAAVFQHDCPMCKHLGYSAEFNADLYLADHGIDQGFVVRFSDEPSDYAFWSLELQMKQRPLFHEMKALAQKMGLL